MKGVSKWNNGWETAASGPLLLGGGVRGGRETNGHNLLQIKQLGKGRALFVSTTPTPPSRRRGLQNWLHPQL